MKLFATLALAIATLFGSAAAAAPADVYVATPAAASDASCIRPWGSGVAELTTQEPPRASGEHSRDGARLHRLGWTPARSRRRAPSTA